MSSRLVLALTLSAALAPPVLPTLSGKALAAADQTLGMALLSAVVDTQNGGVPILARGAGAMEATRGAPGHYLIRFNRDIRNCAFVATVGHPSSAAIQNGFANAMPIGGTDIDAARVHTRSAAGALVDNLSFHLMVFCPR